MEGKENTGLSRLSDFEIKRTKSIVPLKKQVDQQRLNRISEIVDTGDTYTTTAGEIVHVKRVIKA